MSSQNLLHHRFTTAIKPHLPYLCLAVCIVIISYPAWIHAGIPGTDDLSNLNVPQRQLLASFYRHGVWPLWNPDSFAGQPFLAAGQSGPLYLPNLLFVCLPTVFALKASYVFHELLVAVGAYLSAWQFSKSRVGAVVGAVSFADCGFLIGHQIHTQMFDAICWLPLVIFLFVRTFERPRRRRIILCALALSGEIYAGHPQMTFYLCLFLGLYLLLMCLWLKSREALRRFCWCLVPLCGGFALSAAQWLPTLQLVSYSDRSAANPNFLLAGSLPPVGLAQFFMPYLAGGGYTGEPLTFASYAQVFTWQDFWEFTCYAGLAALILALAVLINSFKRNPHVRALALIGGFALLLCVGWNTFAQYILTHAPGFDLFRIPARYVALVDFAVAMLAAIGIATLQRVSTARRLKFSILVIAALAIPAILAIHLFSHANIAPASSYLVPLILCLAIILFCLFENRQHTRFLPMVLACLMVADVSSHAVATTGFVDWQRGLYARPNQITAFLIKHQPGKNWPRIASLGMTSSSITAVGLDRNLSYGLPSVNGYDSVVPLWYAKTVGLTRDDTTFLSQPRSLANALGIYDVITPDDASVPFPLRTKGIQSWHFTVPDVNTATTSLRINVNVQASAVPQYGPLFSITLKSGQHVFTSLVYGWPASAYLVPVPKDWPRYQPTQITIHNEAWNGMYRIDNVQLRAGTKIQTFPVQRTFAPKAWTKVADHNGDTVWANPDKLTRAWLANNKQAPLVHAAGTVTGSLGHPNEQTWHVKAGHTEWLVLSQMYDPNWHATIDGKRTPVVRVDNVLTAVKVGPGQHAVHLTYNPTSFRTGLAVSILTGLSALALLV